MSPPATDLKRHLHLLKELRGHGRSPPPRLAELKAWQSARLHGTYADISAQPHYSAATSFFLDDLYGPKDFSGRDQAMLRIVPAMTRLLPASALETASLAIELEALSEDLDQRAAGALAPGPIDAGSYGRAYRESSKREERERQIELIVAVGERLDALVKKPMVARMLRLMRTPASVAGLHDLQEFLERGFEAFREMHGAADFLSLVRERETEILSRLFSGRPLASSPP